MSDEQYMRIALQCAQRGLGLVEPNPMVGAVIVEDGREIARGYHRRFGGMHAEAEALEAARLAGADVRGATVYVTLEPCCHRNKKTPPCTDALIAAGVSRVVAAMLDPDPNVAGRGVAALRAAGIQADVGVCEGEARFLLREYIKQRKTHRPWVICKWAQTCDGYLALPPQQGRWISSPESLERVHKIRSFCDGVCVGVQTILADDPLLNNRSGQGRQPTRLVLDAFLRTPPSSTLIATARDWPVLIASTQPPPDHAAQHAHRAAALQEAGAEVIQSPASPDGSTGQAMIDLPWLLEELGGRMWTRLLVEGGPRVLRSFLEAGLCDELMVFVAPQSIGAAASTTLPRLDIAEVWPQLGLAQPTRSQIGIDSLLHWPAIKCY